MRARERIDDLTAQHNVIVELFAPQIEKAIAQPHVFGIVLLAKNRQWQFGRGTQNLDVRHIDFDQPGRHFGIFCPRRALANRPIDPDHPFGAKFFGPPKSWRIWIDDALGYAIMIAKIDEQDTSMIADAVAPAGETDVFASMQFAQGAAAMGTVAVHVRVTVKSEEDVGRACAIRQAGGEPHVRRRLSRRSIAAASTQSLEVKAPLHY